MLSWIYAGAGVVLLVALNLPVVDHAVDLRAPGHYVLQIGWLVAGLLLGRALADMRKLFIRLRSRDLGART